MRRISVAPIIVIAISLLIVLGTSLALYSGYTTRLQKLSTAIGEPDHNLSLFEKVFLTYTLSNNIHDLSKPIDLPNNEVIITINPGDSVASISQQLANRKLIPDNNLFINYLIFTGIDHHLQPGTYAFKEPLNLILIGNTLQNRQNQIIQINVLPGWRAEEISNALIVSGVNISETEFLNKVFTQNLEGKLFPGEYHIQKNSSIDEIIDLFLHAYKNNLTPKLIREFNKQGLSETQAIILASIVQRESVLASEMPMIASVLINRINAGMKLQADSTVQYALGFIPEQQTWWKNPLAISDLQYPSPYNTYIVDGLPPAPICNPGLEALNAVAYPAETQYFYFRATCDHSGRHVFSKTFEEHLSKQCP